MSNLRQFFVGTLAVVMGFTMAFGGFTINPANAAAGELVKTSNSSTVYVVDADGVTLHLFPNAAIFESWNYSFDNVKTLPNFSGYTMGAAAEARSGSLLKSFDKSDVYYVADGTLYPIVSETVFYALGLDFNDVFETSQAFVDQYPMGAMIMNADWHVKGQLIKYPNDPAVYLIGDNNTYRAFQSESAFYANRFSFATVLTIPETEVYTAGPLVTGFEHGISTPMGVPGGAVTPPPTGSNLTVSLDPSSPAAKTVVTDSTHSQSLIPFVSVRFTAPADGDVKVTTLRFKRNGISSDSDVSETYLYSGMERVAFGGSLSNSFVTFNDASGLFTVPAGQSKVITLRVDLAAGTNAGKTMAFALESAADVTASSGTVSGSFPAQGATMTTAVASDLGYAIISSFANYPTSNDTSVDADEEDFEVWRFQLQASDQDLHLKSLRFTKVGSVDQDDLQNFRLMQGGTELGSAAMLNADFELFFDMSNNPFLIKKGESKVFSLRADIVGGSNRDFKFTFQYQDDIMLEDQAFGVYVPAAQTIGNTWSVVQPTGDYLVGVGSLTISKATDSPTGNISAGATNLHLGRFEVEATGEDMKVKNLLIAADTSQSTGTGLDNCRILLDGVQIGSTTDCAEHTSSATVTLGSSFVAKAGQTHILDIYGDSKTSTSTNLSNGETVKVYLMTGSSNAQGQNSLTTVNAPTSDVAANTLTVSDASLTISEYTAVGDQTLLAGTNGVKIGAMQLIAGSSEAVNIDSITVTGTSSEFAYLQNLKLMMDGVQIGTTKASPSTSNLFSVNFTVTKGQAKVVEIYADLKTNATGQITPNASATGTGSVTGNSVTGSAPAGYLQTITVGTGTLDISVDANSPKASFLVSPSTGQTVAKFKLDASNSDFWLHEFTLLASTSAIDNVSMVTVEYPTESGTATAVGNFGSNGTLVFYIQDAPMYIEKDDSAVMTVKIDVASTSGAGGADNNDDLRVAFDVSGTFKAIDSAGSPDTDASATAPVNESADLLPNTHVVFKAYPTVAFASDTPSGTLVPSANSLIAKIQITATGNDDVTFDSGNSLVFQYSQNGAANTWTELVTAKDDQGNTLWSTTTNLSTISEFTIDFTTNTLEVGQGTSEVIYIYADTADYTSDGENLQVWLDDTSTDIDWGINNSGNYNHADIIFRGDIYGGALAK